MKVYLDFQILDYINKDETKKYITYFKEQKEWNYLISVAHLEEIYKARKGEKDDKIGLTDALEKTIKEMVNDGIIKPTENGLKYIVKCYEKTYQDIVRSDTQEIILHRSLDRRDMDKESYHSVDLFKGIKYDKKIDYKLVWETSRVKEELDNINKNNNMNFINELKNHNNSLRQDMENKYGKDVAGYMLKQLLRSSNTEIKPAIYSQIRDDYHVLEYVMEQLYLLLTKCGYKRENKDRHANSATYDIQHSICATLCDMFITNDEGFASKFKAIAYYLGIPIDIKTWDEDILPQINTIA